MGFLPPTLLKVTLLYGRFSRFLNRIKGTKSRKTLHICPAQYDGVALDISIVNLKEISVFSVIQTKFLAF